MLVCRSDGRRIFRRLPIEQSPAAGFLPPDGQEVNVVHRFAFRARRMDQEAARHEDDAGNRGAKFTNLVIEAVVTRFFIGEGRDVLRLIVDFSVGVGVTQGVGINPIEADFVGSHGRSHALVVDRAHRGKGIGLDRTGKYPAA